MSNSFLLGDSPASEFYVLMCRENSVCSVFIVGVSSEDNRGEIAWVFTQVNVWLKPASANRKEEEQGVGVSQYRNRLWRATTPSGGLW